VLGDHTPVSAGRNVLSRRVLALRASPARERPPLLYDAVFPKWKPYFRDELGLPVLENPF